VTAVTLPVADLAALADRIRLLPPSAGSTAVVAVDGPSGSGKTVLASELSGLLDDVPVIHLDDIYPGWDGLADAVPRVLEWVLEPLSRKETARYRRFDWPSHTYAEWHDVPDAPVLLIEGVGAGARACAPHLAQIVWAEAPASLRFARGMARDGEGYRPHWERWAEQEATHFATEGTRERADVRLDAGVDGAWHLLP
jgi:hypothetical protein